MCLVWKRLICLSIKGTFFKSKHWRSFFSSTFSLNSLFSFVGLTANSLLIAVIKKAILLLSLPLFTLTLSLLICLSFCLIAVNYPAGLEQWFLKSSMSQRKHGTTTHTPLQVSIQCKCILQVVQLLYKVPSCNALPLKCFPGKETEWLCSHMKHRAVFEVTFSASFQWIFKPRCILLSVQTLATWYKHFPRCL